MFQAPIGKQPLDILVDETYKIIMLTKAEELMLNEFFAQAAFPDAPHYELDQFFATQFPLAVDYGLSLIHISIIKKRRGKKRSGKECYICSKFCSTSSIQLAARRYFL